MRKLAIAVALASSALATPALAKDKAWYVGVEGGGMIVENISYDIDGVDNAVRVKSEKGYDVDGIIGYDFGVFRLETEVAYKDARVDNIRSNVTTPVGAVRVVNGGTFDLGGRTTALSFMVNGLLDFGDDDGIQGFIGGGVGVARVKADRYRVVNSFAFLDDTDTVFAYQGIAGIRAPLSRTIDVSLKYRFFNAENVELIDNSTPSRTWKGRFRSHSILGGIIFNFGAPEPTPTPPPPPVPTPPPPLPTPTATCSPGPFIVFFEWDKYDITSDAAAILDNAVSQYQQCQSVSVMIAGHADRSGTVPYNQALSEKRSAAVKAYLVGRNIPDGTITTQAFGENQPRVQTADGVREVQNRRVEITYGPAAGM